MEEYVLLPRPPNTQTSPLRTCHLRAIVGQQVSVASARAIWARLEAAGLVIAERRGRERWNHLDALPIHAIQERWIGPYAAYRVSPNWSLYGALEIGRADYDQRILILDGNFGQHRALLVRERANVAWTDAKYDSFANGPCPLERIGTSTVACDLSGKGLPGSEPGTTTE